MTPHFKRSLYCRITEKIELFSRGSACKIALFYESLAQRTEDLDFKIVRKDVRVAVEADVISEQEKSK